MNDYLRMLQLVGEGPDASYTVRPIRIDSPTTSGRHPWSRHAYFTRKTAASTSAELVDPRPAVPRLEWVHPVMDVFTNSTRPWGQNDGFIWQGKGVTTALSLGAAGQYRFISGALRPQFLYAQNKEFALSSIDVPARLAPFGYPGRSDIDLPQRFGDDGFGDVHLGESYVEAQYKGLAAGMSMENLWWGPGLRNSIVMSNNAPGFRHVFAGTARPIHTRIGAIEGAWIWGSLGQTEDFVDISDEANQGTNAADDRRFLTGAVVTYEPEWIPNLYVGATQTYMVHARDKVYALDYLAVVNIPFVGDTDRHQRGTDDKLVSLFARWVLPESGFEVYGEWARGDHTSDFRDLFVAPDHSRGFTVGFQKVYKVTPQYYTRVHAEHTFLESPREVGSRDNIETRQAYFYAHEGIKQGYTHRGQVLGAGLGPGAQGQFLRFDLFTPWGRVGLHGLREVFDNDLFYQLRENHFEHQVSIAGGVSWLVSLDRFEASGGVTRIKTFNRDFIFGNDTYNTNLRVSLRYALGVW